MTIFRPARVRRRSSLAMAVIAVLGALLALPVTAGIKHSPPSPEMAKAEAAFAAGDTATAEQIAERLVATSDADTPRALELLGRIELREGEVARGKGDFTEALRQYALVARLTQYDEVRAQANQAKEKLRAQMLQAGERGHFEEAMAISDAFLAEDVNDRDALQTGTHARYQTGDFLGAIRGFGLLMKGADPSDREKLLLARRNLIKREVIRVRDGVIAGTPDPKYADAMAEEIQHEIAGQTDLAALYESWAYLALTQQHWGAAAYATTHAVLSDPKSSAADVDAAKQGIDEAIHDLKLAGANFRVALKWRDAERALVHEFIQGRVDARDLVLEQGLPEPFRGRLILLRSEFVRLDGYRREMNEALAHLRELKAKTSQEMTSEEVDVLRINVGRTQSNAHAAEARAKESFARCEAMTKEFWRP